MGVFRAKGYHMVAAEFERDMGFAEQALGVERAVGKRFGRLVLPFGAAHQTFYQVAVFGAVNLRDCFGVAPAPIAFVGERVAGAG